MSGNEGLGNGQGIPFPVRVRSSVMSGDCSSSIGNMGGLGRGEVNGGNFRLRLHAFPGRLTLFRENLTLLFEAVAIPVSDWRGSIV